MPFAELVEPLVLRAATVFEHWVSRGIVGPFCPLERPLRLTWIAKRDPFQETDTFRTQRIPAQVLDLVAWEVDFVRELLRDHDVTYSWASAPSALEKCHIVVYSRNQFPRDDIRRALAAAKPQIVFHMSDEWGKDVAWHAFLKRFPLVLRQHHFKSYGEHENIKTIPLGYMGGMFDANASTTAPETIAALRTRERTYAWAFVGSIKGERAAALAHFADIAPSFSAPVHPSEMAEVYRSSKFVVCPAGNVNILCFRNFEASICGAIPVVAGCTAEQYEEATGVLGNPPWIFHETWAEARDEVRALLSDEAALCVRRDAILDWWVSEMARVKRQIAAALT